jgi:hypothetical protein
MKFLFSAGVFTFCGHYLHFAGAFYFRLGYLHFVGIIRDRGHLLLTGEGVFDFIQFP